MNKLNNIQKPSNNNLIIPNEKSNLENRQDWVIANIWLKCKNCFNETYTKQMLQQSPEVYEHLLKEFYVFSSSISQDTLTNALVNTIHMYQLAHFKDIGSSMYQQCKSPIPLNLQPQLKDLSNYDDGFFAEFGFTEKPRISPGLSKLISSLNEQTQNLLNYKLDQIKCNENFEISKGFFNTKTYKFAYTLYNHLKGDNIRRDYGDIKADIEYTEEFYRAPLVDHEGSLIHKNQFDKYTINLNTLNTDEIQGLKVYLTTSNNDEARCAIILRTIDEIQSNIDLDQSIFVFHQGSNISFAHRNTFIAYQKLKINETGSMHNYLTNQRLSIKEVEKMFINPADIFNKETRVIPRYI
jgi:hypothetical protein